MAGAFFIRAKVADFYLHQLPDFRGKWAALRIAGPVFDGALVRSRYEGVLLGLDTRDRTNRLGVLGGYGRTVADVVETLQPGDCFIDVGANCGVFSIMAGRRVGPQGLVIAFEPCFETFAKLVRNIAGNGLTNILPINMALGPTTGTARLDTSAHEHSGRYAVAAEPTLTGCPIHMVDLDGMSALSSFIGDRRTVVKVDVEGFEHAVLEGLRSLMVRPQTEWVVVEVDAGNMGRYGTSPDQLYALMASLGFRASSSGERPGHYDEVYMKAPRIAAGRRAEQPAGEPRQLPQLAVAGGH